MKHSHEDTIALPYANESNRRHWLIIAGLVLVLGFFFTLGVIRLAYRGKILPGAQAYGIYLGGLSKVEASTLITSMSEKYQGAETVLIRTTSDQPIRIKAKDLGLSHVSEPVINELYSVGRQGWIGQQIYDEFKLLIGLSQPSTEMIALNEGAITQALSSTIDTYNTAVIDPQLVVNESIISITPGISGKRVSLPRTVARIQEAARTFDRIDIELATYSLNPVVTEGDLSAKRATIERFRQQPLVVKYNDKTWSFGAQEIASWVDGVAVIPDKEDLLYRAYAQTRTSQHQADFSETKIQASLAAIAQQINQAPVDAKLSISGDRATIFQQSRDGIALEMSASAQKIRTALSETQANAPTDLVVAITKAEVSDENIDNLGIKELLSEGVTYFPGSSRNRLQNIRVGTARYQGVLLKPGEVFSFGELLGEVGPEQGYAEGRVILEGRQESAYGGGLCQVSSTAFRAALLAGLPIIERVNHSFAVSYYTAPYGVPGVDATIYYPQVDFKFKNDTDHHILIQTDLQGTTLKFRFYGTKKKSGNLRGPFFIYGNSDPNVPSRTVFYRDIIVNGQVVKTDTFYTTYKSALDFPVAD